MNTFTEEQIKEAAREAARRYLAQGESMEASIEDITIKEREEYDAIVHVSWDYEERETNDPPPDNMLFSLCVVEGDNGDELYVEGPDF